VALSIHVQVSRLLLVAKSLPTTPLIDRALVLHANNVLAFINLVCSWDCRTSLFLPVVVHFQCGNIYSPISAPVMHDFPVFTCLYLLCTNTIAWGFWSLNSWYLVSFYGDGVYYASHSRSRHSCMKLSTIMHPITLSWSSGASLGSLKLTVPLSSRSNYCYSTSCFEKLVWQPAYE